MSRIDELVEQLCPEGVEYKNLGQVARIVGGRDYKHLGEGDIPVYGSGGPMTYVDAAAYDKPTVLLPRKGSISNVFYLEEPFWNVDTVYYTEIDTTQIHPRFFYHVILNEHIEKLNTSNAARPALTRAVLNKIPIPVPPMEIQQEIVRVLDSFAELEAELEARLRQYAYYRDELLDFAGCDDVRWTKLKELYTVTSAKRITQAEQVEDGIPFLRLSDIATLITEGKVRAELFISKRRYGELQRSGHVPKEGDLLITARGTLGKCYVVKDMDQFYFQDGMIAWLKQQKNSPLPACLFIQLFFGIVAVEVINWDRELPFESSSCGDGHPRTVA